MTLEIRLKGVYERLYPLLIQVHLFPRRLRRRREVKRRSRRRRRRRRPLGKPDPGNLVRQQALEFRDERQPLSDQPQPEQDGRNGGHRRRVVAVVERPLRLQLVRRRRREGGRGEAELNGRRRRFDLQVQVL